jgi:DNA-binding NarL/FixJ family response regulator
MEHWNTGTPTIGHLRDRITAPRSHVMYELAGRNTPSTQLTSHTANLPGAAERGNRRCHDRILIVDDCRLHRENLAAVFAVTGTAMPTVAWDLRSLCASLDEATPDIVLLNMVTRDSLTLLRWVRDSSPQAKVIVVGITEDDESEIVACAEAGVAGYHLRAESLDDLLVLISKVSDGEFSCTSRVSAILLKRLSTLGAQQPEPKELVLTARELQILRMLEIGLSNQDIADRLCIALHTVKNHVHNVLSKLGVSTRAEAAALSRSVQNRALRTKVLDTEPV